MSQTCPNGRQPMGTCGSYFGNQSTSCPEGSKCTPIGTIQDVSFCCPDSTTSVNPSTSGMFTDIYIGPNFLHIANYQRISAHWAAYITIQPVRDQCKHSLKRNRQDDCQYVHDEVLYISSKLHQLSRAVIHGWTDGSFLDWHCVMLITYINIAFIRAEQAYILIEEIIRSSEQTASTSRQCKP